MSRTYPFRIDRVWSIEFDEATAETTVVYTDDDRNEVTLTMHLHPDELDELMRALVSSNPT